MNGEAVKEIALLASSNRKPHVVEAYGKTYLMVPDAGGTWKQEDLGGPGIAATPLLISTLTGFVDYVNGVMVQIDDCARDSVLIHVESESKVTLVGPRDADFGKRDTGAVVQFHNLLGPAGIEFGRHMDLERFVVALQTLFAQTPARDEVLRVCGTVSDETVETSIDDGVSQNVVARAGVVMAERTKVPNPVMLRPFRTFREVEQPESAFVLRAQKAQPKPVIALFEADGGKWKLEAIASIRAYLADRIEGIAIVA